MSAHQPGGPPHPEMGVVAKNEAAKSSEEINAMQEPPTPAPPSALVDSFRDQIERNHAAHRSMRWFAFGFAGAVAVCYLIALLLVLYRLLDPAGMAAVLGAPSASAGWHGLVLVGIVIVIFAAIPLSLTMALVKMISDRQQDEELALKTPSTELGKILLDLLKSMVNASRDS